MTKHLQVFVVTTESAAVKLRLLEQACTIDALRCTAVANSRCVLVSAFGHSGWRVHAAIIMTRHLQVFAFATESAAVKLRLLEQACTIDALRCTAVAASRCVLVYAFGHSG